MNSEDIIFAHHQIKKIEKSKKRIFIPSKYKIKNKGILVLERIKKLDNFDIPYLECVLQDTVLGKNYMNNDKLHSIMYYSKIDSQGRLPLRSESLDLLQLEGGDEYYFIGKKKWFEIYSLREGKDEINRNRRL